MTSLDVIDSLAKRLLESCKNYTPNFQRDFDHVVKSLSAWVLICRGFGPGDYLEDLNYLEHFPADAYEIYYQAAKDIHAGILIATHETITVGHRTYTRYYVTSENFLRYAINKEIFSDSVLYHSFDYVKKRCSQERGRPKDEDKDNKIEALAELSKKSLHHYLRSCISFSFGHGFCLFHAFL